MKTIEYRRLPDFPGYEVDSLGQLWSWRKRGGGKPNLRAKTRRKMRMWADHDGYPLASLYRDGEPRRTMRIHRQICMAFHGRPEPGIQVRHLDGNPGNNCPENLCWGTPKENVADSLADRHNTRCRAPNAKLTAPDVRVIWQAGKAGFAVWKLAYCYCVHKTTIWRILAGTTWGHVTGLVAAS